MLLKSAAITIQLNKEPDKNHNNIGLYTGTLQDKNKHNLCFDFGVIYGRILKGKQRVTFFAYDPEDEVFPEMKDLYEKLPEITAFPEMLVELENKDPEDDLHVTAITQFEFDFITTEKPVTPTDTECIHYEVVPVDKAYMVKAHFTETLLATCKTFPQPQ